MKTKSALSEIAALLLALLFGYTATSKIYDWHGTRNSLYNQVFPDWLAESLLYGLPAVELLVAGSLTGIVGCRMSDFRCPMPDVIPAADRDGIEPSSG